MDINYIKLLDTLGQVPMGGGLKKEDAKLVRAAIEAHFYAPKVAAEKFRKQIEAAQAGLNVTTDFARLSSQAFSVFNEMPGWDNFYERAYKLTQAENGRWDIHTVTDGLEIQKVPEGDRLNVRGMSSGLQTARTAKYGGAMEWTDEMIRWRQIARMQDKAERLRNRYWRYKADQHYGLLASAAPADGSNGNVTTYNATANTQVTRDIDTIDAASYTLGARNREKDYTMGTALLYLPMSLKKRLGTAFNVSGQNVVLSSSQAAGSVLDRLQFMVEPIFTWNTQIPANTGIMVIPGNKIQRVDEVPPFMLDDQDILALTFIMAIWSYYGAAIGDTGQVQRVLFA